MMRRLRSVNRMMALYLALALACCPATPVFAASIPGYYGGVGNLVAPAANQIPQIQNIVQGVAGLEQVSNNGLIVHQDQEKAIVDWKSFDIGVNAWTHFDQQGNTNWSALNRIYDQNPSQIFGKLTADGTVYLINQNGMLFSPGASVNIHSLVASSLNLTNDDFLAGTRAFETQNYMDASMYDGAAAVVANHGTIQTDENGSVILLGPTVENSGSITAPLGNIILASGTTVTMENQIQASNNKTVVNAGGDSSLAVNYDSGRLEAELGNVGMYGRVVNQEGLIRAVTAVKSNGQIELKASETVTLGEQSRTESPISTSSETVHESFEFGGGEIDISSGGLIDVKGSIVAPSGSVSLNADSRVYLDSESLIDVSGNWVILPAGSSVASLQLNSVELKDDYAQKDGTLQGETIYFYQVEGSGIGDVSGALNSEEKTALEFSTQGGIIQIDSGGDVVARSGSMLDFSGGGIIYEEGHVETTLLISGNQVYRIEDAPENVAYDAIIGPDNPISDTNERFGITTSYGGGFYVGSANPILNYHAGYQEGADAGILNVNAPVVLLNATLDGSVLPGVYQVEETETQDENGYQSTLGTVRPSAGTFNIGKKLTDSRYEDVDPIVEEILVSAQKFILPDDFSATSDLPDALAGVSMISEEILNDSSLKNVTLAVREGIVVDADARIAMDPTSSLTLFGRHIEHHGTIVIPEGSVSMELASNLTTDEFVGSEPNPEYVSSADLGYERIYLATGSIIDVSGQQVDLSTTASLEGLISDYSRIEGGDVSLVDGTLAGEGVIIMPGAAIDASGGWRIDESGEVDCGDGGSIQVAGSSIALEGDLYTHSLSGANGGTLDLHAQQVTVAAQQPEPNSIITDLGATDPLLEGVATHLMISDDQIDLTGASNIVLTSVTDIAVEDGVKLEPSTLKISGPGSGAVDSNGNIANYTSAEDVYNNGEYIRADTNEIQKSSITLTAGKSLGGHYVIPGEIDALNQRATARVDSDASVIVSPMGNISVSGPSVEIAGTVSAPAGSIGLESTSDLSGAALAIESGSLVSAAAYLMPADLLADTGVAVAYKPLDGGAISLSAFNLFVEPDAVLDVSGTDRIEHLLLTPNGSYTGETTAGSPGTLEFEYSKELQLDGVIKADARLDGMIGGTLSLTRTDSFTALSVGSEDMQTYIHSGFDNITISSYGEIQFADELTTHVDGKLTLDAPIISTDDHSVSLSAPWIVLTNTYWPGEESPALQGGNLKLTADWIDIAGDIALSGFETISLHANRDITLADYFYDTKDSLPVVWSGSLETAADLLIDADRLYPTTQTVFILSSGGDLTTRSTTDNSTAAPVMSAGGSLAVNAANITHTGKWYAPAGQLQFTVDSQDGRIYLENGSILSVAGGARVNYGMMDDEAVVWQVLDKASNKYVEFEGALESTVSLSGDEVVMQDGALVDLSGGGEIFAYGFLPGVEGSTDPLEETYVIVPGAGNSGETIYLEGNALVDEGFYTILDESFAFSDGAMIVEDLGAAAGTYGDNSLTSEGYPISAGYTTVGSETGATYATSQPHYFSVRESSDVLAEGNFTIEQITTGDAGSLSVQANTTIFNATVQSTALEGYTGGTLSLASKKVIANTAGAQLPADFSADSPIPDELMDQLIVNATAISNSAFETVTLGDTAITEQVVFDAGSILEAVNLTVAASDRIVVASDSMLSASGEAGGILSLISPEGMISIEPSATLHATHDIRLDTINLNLDGNLEVDNSSLTLINESIFITANHDIASISNGLFIDEAMWAKVEGIDSINLCSHSDITFLSDFRMQAADILTLDSDRIVLSTGVDVTVEASQIQLQNTSLKGEVFAEIDNPTNGPAGSLFFQSDDMTIVFGAMTDQGGADDAANDLSIIGAGAMTIQAANELVVSGTGNLVTQGDLSIESAAIMTALTASVDDNGAVTYATADAGMISSSGTVFTQANGNTWTPPDSYGGELTLKGRAVDHSGLILSPAGSVQLVATGTTDGDGIYLREGSSIDARGSDYATSGTVFLETEHGSIEIAAGAIVDVSAGGQGDAGAVSIFAPEKNVSIEGDLYGQAGEGGGGGSFYLETLSINDFATIAELLAESDFEGKVELLARQGNITVNETDEMTADSITLLTDGGSVVIEGELDASGTEGGGTLEIYASDDINLLDGSVLDASATEAGDGGQVLLAAASGTIDFHEGAKINVSGSGTDFSNGAVYLRAIRNENGITGTTGMNMVLKGEIVGASAVIAEGVGIYENNTVTADYLDGLVDQAADWTAHLRLDNDTTPAVENILTVLAGIEIRSAENLAVTEEIDLAGYAEDMAYGVLTLRSAGDLIIGADIIDARTDVLTLRENTAQESWGINLVAGANFAGSDFMAIDRSSGSLPGRILFEDGVRVYTENATIQFASAGNTQLGVVGSQDEPMTNNRMQYNIGSFNGTVFGLVGGDLNMKDGGIQTATGDIRIEITGDLNFIREENTIGAIRTIGEAPDPDPYTNANELRNLLNRYWSYADGGDIDLEVQGDVIGQPFAIDCWDASSYNGAFYHAEYSNGGSRGIVTMAGGDITLNAGGRVTCAVGLFGMGDLDLTAKQDLDGRFLVYDGQIDLNSYENFGTLTSFDNQPIEAFDTQIELVAQGSIELGTILNPTIANYDYSGPSDWDLRYTEASSVALRAITGSVMLTGSTRFYDNLADQKSRIRILPGTLIIDAATDILIGQSFYLAPSEAGNLALTAGGDIRSMSVDSDSQNRYILAMSDVDPSLVYGLAEDGRAAYQLITDTYAHSDALLHKDDPVAATITATGDVRDVLLYIPKASSLIAGGDIADIFYHTQNVNLDDVTVIAAGNDIRFSTGIGTTYQAGIEIGGPGSIIVTAGNSIDLGTTSGIQAVGNLYNQVLPTPDEELDEPAMRLAVYSGVEIDVTESSGKLDQTEGFFDDLREQGQEYSAALAEGDTEAAQQILDEINSDTIDPFFDGVAKGGGDIDMVNSQIYTSGNAGDIYILATGEINVGKSTFRQATDQSDNSGIYTTSGGSINVYVDDDLNVNESRLMTFMGGDITAWSQDGNINAGRGSKTAISVSEATVDLSGDEPKIVFTPPAVGSGVRALTYDPDGVEGPEEQPEIGDIYIFAPQGEIDAGEAGIAGKNIILAATKVVNVQNIEVGGSSVGVPDVSASAASIGALAGSGAVSETSNIAGEQTALGNAKERFSEYVADLTETLVPKWLAVEVVGFGEPSDSAVTREVPVDQEGEKEKK
ncbi:hypothetical protein DSCA_22910 [Desulfosarcina alkanivorans]|uniref:Filamentous haemagglutinin FhaB/tRNA nuclease CdiA-like TPS domain-containing protein n=1 Tax=Desulfosarcina alkanivorans TaxID=571177 RepID=A0A5K7YN83_9BACT|nr:filamentous haemagglutinin family protein [Desulfosarcina alkanivorans]BBO68361.1 hypothetical protein DSCA_22910 [Desulfosarcina alkanivorans]